MSDKWDFRVGDLLTQNRYKGWDCKHKLQVLANEMKQSGEKYTIGYGDKGGMKHVWIEYNGRILDPSEMNPTPDMYKKEKEIDSGDLDEMIYYFDTMHKIRGEK